MKTLYNYVIIGCLFTVMSGLVITEGCKTTPQKVAYQAAGTTEVSVEAALTAYDAFAKAGKTTVAQNQQVAAAYGKYQQAFALACDAGSVYAATSITNSTASQAALTQATTVAAQSLSDLENLITSFGVKL